MSSTQSAELEGVRGRVLLVDDEDLVLRLLSEVLEDAGHATVAARSVDEALGALDRETLDVVVCDINLPGTSGMELLRTLRSRDRGLPVILLTGGPSMQTAVKAVEYGAFRYLTKPLKWTELLQVVQDALRARSLARARDPLGARAELERRFHAALDGLWIAFQPILSSESQQIVGYEALMRSREPSLPDPQSVIDAAEKLGAVHTLGRALRSRIASAIEAGPSGVTYFVNVHPSDLADPDLLDASAPLSRHGRRVVLELTERASIEGVSDLHERLRSLRALRYRIAVDDLGAGYAGLSYFATVHPDLVKIDMSLVQAIDRDPVKQRVVLSLTQLVRNLGIEIVGEGVETIGERDLLVALGCTHLQGFLFAQPGPPFPSATWSPDRISRV
jgi:EAL domain-containing protein (putative c-di-GMP-specific phosphodiesterase class I)